MRSRTVCPYRSACGVGISMPDRIIAAFGEDNAHQLVVGSLIARVAAELGLSVDVGWHSARHGHGRVVAEVREYLRDVKGQRQSVDLIVIATDANCKGLLERSRQIPVDGSPAPVILAIPDPHIERWLLLDGAAFKGALGEGCQAPDRKCARDRYKMLLIEAVLKAGVVPSLGGIEFAEDIIQRMDLARAAAADASLRQFLDALRQQLRVRRP